MWSWCVVQLTVISVCPAGKIKSQSYGSDRTIYYTWIHNPSCVSCYTPSVREHRSQSCHEYCATCHWRSAGRRKISQKNINLNISTAGRRIWGLWGTLKRFQIFSREMQDNERLEWAGARRCSGDCLAYPPGMSCFQKCLRSSL